MYSTHLSRVVDSTCDLLRVTLERGNYHTRIFVKYNSILVSTTWASIKSREEGGSGRQSESVRESDGRREEEREKKKERERERERELLQKWSHQ